MVPRGARHGNRMPRAMPTSVDGMSIWRWGAWLLLASVEFNGMIREEPSAGPSPFREVWNMSKSRSGGSGWLVAGVQALQ